MSNQKNQDSHDPERVFLEPPAGTASSRADPSAVRPPISDGGTTTRPMIGLSAQDVLMADLTNRFTHHPPVGDQVQVYMQLRQGGLNLAVLMVHSAPPSRELSLALTKLEEAVMWANAAIARHSKAPTT